MTVTDEEVQAEHQWCRIVFNYRQWTECLCGFEPQSQEEFDQHTKEFQVDTDDRG